MKRIMACLLMLTLLVPLCVAVIPLGSHAADPAAEVPVNHAQGLTWNKKVGGPTVTVTENGAVMSNVHNAWDSAGCNILPALQSALGDGNAVSVKLTVEIRATMTEGKRDSVVSVHPLIRGGGSHSASGSEEWNAQYAASLGGDPALFAMSGSNIMMNFTSDYLLLSHDAWQTYAVTWSLTRNQIDCGMLSEWNFCVDNISPTEVLDTVEFRNLSIVISRDEQPVYSDWAEGEMPQPRDAYTTEIWSPAEIILHSSMDYANPYTATEIDATFTHTDGTTITLPGFWMKGKVWAVRFSPTKVGEWTYTVTCKDAANTGLHATGRVTAIETTKDTEIARHGFVTVETGKHYYQYADGTPFFWLGDTNWQAFTNVSTTVCNYPGCGCGSQFRHLVSDRVAKGFTVFQTYFVPEAGNGEKPLWLGRGHEQPDIDVFNDKVDEMFAYLHERGMMVALGLGCHTSTPERMELEDFLRFTRYVVARYACYSLVWIAGQEINIAGNGKTPGHTSMDYYMAASALIEELDGYSHPNSAHMYPVMATDESAQRLDTAEWHDSWTIQGGHGDRYSSNVGYMQSSAFYESYYTATGSGHVKPFVESESNYEDINCGAFTGYDANRISAWKAMLSGSAGFTYGVTGIWAGCFSTDTYTGWYDGTSSYSYEPWYMGLGKPGSFEVAYMKRFFETIGPWYELIPRFPGSRDATFLAKRDSYMAATEDGALIVSYFFGERGKTGTLKNLDPSKTYDAYWFNTLTGKFIPVEKGIVSADGNYAIPDKPNAGDWVFLLTALGLGEHYEERLMTDLNPTYAQVPPTGEVVTPVSVTAMGGITYRGAPKESQIMTDRTAWLYDGDPATTWIPSANRTTQTFLFDLGSARKLTHIQINPAEGTMIPTFRVEGSNDGEHWTILTDTSLRDVENPGAGSEPLQGTYRYVKVLLHNAKNESPSVLDTLPYKAMLNPMNNQCYSVTEITDILIYTDGEGTPTPEIWVASTRGDDPDGGEQETNPESDAPIATESDAACPTDPTDDGKGCASCVGFGVVCLLTALAGCTLLKRRDIAV